MICSVVLRIARQARHAVNKSMVCCPSLGGRSTVRSAGGEAEEQRIEAWCVLLGLGHDLGRPQGRADRRSF
jgi:hypothetical protein